MAIVKLKMVRCSFPDVYVPKEFKTGDNKPRYSCTFLIEPGSENHKAVEAAILEAAKEKFGEKWEQKLAGFKGQKNQYCYLAGEVHGYEGYEGMMALASHRPAKNGPVGVFDNKIDPATGKVAVLTQNSGKPYGGCYVNAVVEIYGQTGEFPGVRAGLRSVQFAKDGDAFSASKPASPDDFEPLEQGASASAFV